jgi:di/tricarboxylate transporter
MWFVVYAFFLSMWMSNTATNDDVTYCFSVAALEETWKKRSLRPMLWHMDALLALLH